MKPQAFAALASILVVTALVLLFAGRTTPGADQTAETPLPTVTVLGEGEVRAKPDQVTLTFGISTWTQGASAGEAEALNLASVTRLTEALRSAGVDGTSIDVEQPVVAPLTRQDYAGKTYLTGYQVSRRASATLTNVLKADAVIAAALANGATALESAAYRLGDPEPVRQKAVQAAIDQARSRASAIAAAQDRTLGSLLSVEVVQEETPDTAADASPAHLLFRVRVRATFGF